MGRRDLQLTGRLETGGNTERPELTRSEYLRLLVTARANGWERAFFLVKLFGITALPVRTIPCVTVEAVAAGEIIEASGGSTQRFRVPPTLRAELLQYARRQGVTSGPLFTTRNGAPVTRSGLSACIQSLAKEADIAPEKCNPRCLRKLCQKTLAGIEANVTLLIQRTYDCLLETEQMTVGWAGSRGPEVTAPSEVFKMAFSAIQNERDQNGRDPS